MRPAVSTLCVTALALLAVQGIFGAEEAPAPPPTGEKKSGIFGRVTRMFGGGEKKEEPKEAPPPATPPPTTKSKSKAKPKAEETPAKKTESTPSPTTGTGQPGPKPTLKSTGKGSSSTASSSSSKSGSGSTKSKAKAKAKPATPKSKDTAKKTEEPKKEDSKPVADADGKKDITDKIKGPDADKPKTPAPAPDATAAAGKDDKPADTAATKPDAKETGGMKHGGEFDDISAAFGTKQDLAPAPKTEAPKPPPEITSGTLPPPPPLPSSDGSWEIVKLDHDYVTADSIQRFYRFNTLKVDGKHVWMRSAIYIVKAEIGSQELLINNTKFILSFPVASKNGKALFSRVDLCKLIDPVLVPNHIATAEVFDTVVIDAGHGGHDSGAKGVYGYEKDFTLKMATSLQSALIKRGFRTVLTRSTDDFISLPGRVAIANATSRSIFISLHFNSAGASATGIETWALSPQGTSSTFMGNRGSDGASFRGNNRDSENIALATAVHAMVIHSLSTLADRGIVNRSLVDRGIKRARWTVLTGCNRPGILFEGGFVTNATEGRLIAAQTYRDYLCNAIADAVLNYRKALHPNVARPSLKR